MTPPGSDREEYEMSKAKVMDPNRMEYIYAETMQYKRKVANIADEIRKEVKLLSSPEFLDGMRGGQGDTAVAAIKNIAKSADALAGRAVSLSQFLDQKIEALAILKRDKAGFDGASAKAASSTNHIKK